MKKQNQPVEIFSTRREAMMAIVAAYPGGRECAAARLGLTLRRFDNHLYCNNGASPLTDEQLQLLESETGTTYLASYIAALYSGVFVPVADPASLDNLDLYQRAVKTSASRGRVDSIIEAALADGVIDGQEVERILSAHRQHISARHEEVTAVITLHSKSTSMSGGA